MQIQPQQIDVEVEYEDPEERMRKKAEKLQAFGSSLGGQRDEWIRSRGSYGVDKRWIEDEDQYNGKDNIAKAASQMMTSVEQGYPVTTQMAKPHRSTVFIGMTRQKTNAAEARLADILLPTDDRNWGIQPTPSPELMGMSKDNKMAWTNRASQSWVRTGNQSASVTLSRLCLRWPTRRPWPCRPRSKISWSNATTTASCAK